MSSLMRWVPRSLLIRYYQQHQEEHAEIFLLGINIHRRYNRDAIYTTKTYFKTVPTLSLGQRIVFLRLNILSIDQNQESTTVEKSYCLIQFGSFQRLGSFYLIFIES